MFNILCEAPNVLLMFFNSKNVYPTQAVFEEFLKKTGGGRSG